jgi:hypothetical protein
MSGIGTAAQRYFNSKAAIYYGSPLAAAKAAATLPFIMSLRQLYNFKNIKIHLLQNSQHTKCFSLRPILH